MNKSIQKNSVRSFLNKTFRTPVRTEVTSLDTGVTFVTETYKNKKIIFVSSEKNERFNLPI